MTTHLVSPANMLNKTSDTVRSSLSKTKTDTFHRKPVLICTRTPSAAKELYNFLKSDLRDIDCRKIVCLSDGVDVDEKYDLLGKQTVYVVTD